MPGGKLGARRGHRKSPRRRTHLGTMTTESCPRRRPPRWRGVTVERNEPWSSRSRSRVAALSWTMCAWHPGMPRAACSSRGTDEPDPVLHQRSEGCLVYFERRAFAQSNEQPGPGLPSRRPPIGGSPRHGAGECSVEPRLNLLSVITRRSSCRSRAIKRSILQRNQTDRRSRPPLGRISGSRSRSPATP